MPKNPASTTKTCRKCGGSGYLPHFARTDAGRCWSCTGLAQPLSPEVLADDEAYRLAVTGRDERGAARRAARAAGR